MLRSQFRLFSMLSTTLLLIACGGEDTPTPKLTVLEGGGGDWSSPRFSPDGSRVAFERTIPDSDTFETSVAVMNADGTQAHFLGEGHSPAWSTDGTRVFYSSSRSIISKAAEGGTAESALASERVSVDLNLSPDGKSLVYIEDVHGLRLLDLATGVVQPLTEGYAVTPAFSPDGRRVAYVAVGDSYELRVLSLDTAETTVVKSSPSRLSEPDWLPDGTLAALTIQGITFFDLSGATPQTRLVHEERAATGLDVSQDGKKLVFTVRERDALFVLTDF